MGKLAESVGERIRLIRRSKGFSQEKVALIANLTTSYIGQVERGVKSPTVDSLEKIALALNVNVFDFFDFEQQRLEVEYSIRDKILFQLEGISVKDQEAVYKVVKEMIDFKNQRYSPRSK